MSLRTEIFYKNDLYKILTNQLSYSPNDLLRKINDLLHTQPELAEICHPIEGSYFHIVCRHRSHRENIAFRLIYALSTAGADPNATDELGNTALHEVFIRGTTDNDIDLIQALFRVGVDQRIVNHQGKIAADYMNNSPLLITLYNGYGNGIWAAIEQNDLNETERLIKGFIKIDCKHNSNKTLLDKVCDKYNSNLIDILAEYQATIEFVHSILACDWDRTAIIFRQKYQVLKINSYDSIHRLTLIRKYSKSILELCLNARSSKPFEIIFNSSLVDIDINFLCTDGLPFFFHCFDEFICDEQRKHILDHANFTIKSFKGETILYYLIDLYIQNENDEYLNLFIRILNLYPLILIERNYKEQTIIEYIELQPSLVIYNKLRPFYDAITNILTLQLTKNSIINEYILNNFGYLLLFIVRNQYFQMTKYVYKQLNSLKVHENTIVLIEDFLNSIINDDFKSLINILQINTKIYYAKDRLGRSCTHLAVLYHRYSILKFICETYNDAINFTDNLNRTAYHYACIMNDEQSIEIFKQTNIKGKLIFKTFDCENLYADDYLLNQNLTIQRFQENELKRKTNTISNILKLFFYIDLKKAIENDSIDEIQLMNDRMIKMGFCLNDINSNSDLNDYVQGQRYVPLLFIALEKRSLSSIKFLIELGISLDSSMYVLDTDHQLKWVSFHSRLEELECLDIINLINDLENDKELEVIMKNDSNSKTKSQSCILL